MTKPSQIKPVGASHKTCLLIYGDPGVQKTRLAGSGPAAGLKTLIVRPPLDHTDSILGSGTEEWVVQDWSAMDDVQDYIRHDGNEEYDWVWLDSISLFQDQGLDDIWGDVLAEKPARKRYGADRGEYGINMWRLGGWVRHMVGQPGFNFGIVAHPFETETLDGELKLAPYIQGRNMSPKICGYMNIVAFMEQRRHKEKDELYSVLHTEGTDRYYAKDQVMRLADGIMVNPTMDKITEAIERGRGVASITRKRTKTVRPTRTRRRREHSG